MRINNILDNFEETKDIELEKFKKEMKLIISKNYNSSIMHYGKINSEYCPPCIKNQKCFENFINKYGEKNTYYVFTTNEVVLIAKNDDDIHFTSQNM